MGKRWILGLAPWCLCLFVLDFGAFGQENAPGEKKEQPARQVFVPVEACDALQMTTRKPILKVLDERDKVIVTAEPRHPSKKGPYKVQRFPSELDTIAKVHPSPTAPRMVVLEGHSSGVRRLTLIDEDGTREVVAVTSGVELFVLLEGSRPLQMASGKSIRKIQNLGDKIARVESVPDDRASVKVSGLATGEGRFTLTDEDGKTEIYSVVVRSGKTPDKHTLILLTGEEYELQMTTKKPLRSIANGREKIVSGRPKLEDPSVVLLTGGVSGVSRLSLTDADGTCENYVVIVREEKWRGRNGKNTQNQLFLAIGEKYRWRTASKKAIQDSTQDKYQVAIEVDSKDSSVLLITAKAVGVCRLDIADQEGKEERVTVYVREEKSPKEK